MLQTDLGAPDHVAGNQTQAGRWQVSLGKLSESLSFLHIRVPPFGFGKFFRVRSSFGWFNRVPGGLIGCRVVNFCGWLIGAGWLILESPLSVSANSFPGGTWLPVPPLSDGLGEASRCEMHRLPVKCSHMRGPKELEEFGREGDSVFVDVQISVNQLSKQSGRVVDVRMIQ